MYIVIEIYKKIYGLHDKNSFRFCNYVKTYFFKSFHQIYLSLPLVKQSEKKNIFFPESLSTQL